MASTKVAALMSRLRDLDIQRVEIRYDGSGDSGSIDDVDFYKEKWESVDDVAEDLRGLCEDLGYHILNQHYQWDWYNNDGGYGTVIITPDTDTITIDGYVRELTEAAALVSLENIEF
jgi:hypothetical protein